MTSNRLWKTCLIASACCILTLRAQPLERKYAASDGSSSAAVIITPRAQPRAQDGSSDDDRHGIAAPEAGFDIMHLDDGLTDEERARLDIEDLERDGNDNESLAEAEQQQDYGKVVESLTGSLAKQQSKKQYRNQQQLVASYAF